MCKGLRQMSERNGKQDVIVFRRRAQPVVPPCSPTLGSPSTDSRGLCPRSLTTQQVSLSPLPCTDWSSGPLRNVPEGMSRVGTGQGRLESSCWTIGAWGAQTWKPAEP